MKKDEKKGFHFGRAVVVIVITGILLAIAIIIFFIEALRPSSTGDL